MRIGIPGWLGILSRIFASLWTTSRHPRSLNILNAAGTPSYVSAMHWPRIPSPISCPYARTDISSLQRLREGMLNGLRFTCDCCCAGTVSEYTCWTWSTRLVEITTACTMARTFTHLFRAFFFWGWSHWASCVPFYTCTSQTEVASFRIRPSSSHSKKGLPDNLTTFLFSKACTKITSDIPCDCNIHFICCITNHKVFSQPWKWIQQEHI